MILHNWLCYVGPDKNEFYQMTPNFLVFIWRLIDFSLSSCAHLKRFNSEGEKLTSGYNFLRQDNLIIVIKYFPKKFVSKNLLLAQHCQSGGI